MFDGAWEVVECVHNFNNEMIICAVINFCNTLLAPIIGEVCGEFDKSLFVKKNKNLITRFHNV